VWCINRARIGTEGKSDSPARPVATESEIL